MFHLLLAEQYVNGVLILLLSAEFNARSQKCFGTQSLQET